MMKSPRGTTSSRKVTSEYVMVAERVSKSFGSHQVLKDVNIRLKRGQVVCLIGRSGSGKTTFLRCVNHLEAIDGGSIRVDGDHVGYLHRDGQLREASDRLIAERRREIGMVFQQFNLFPHLTVLQNIVEAPIHVLGRSPRDAQDEAEELLVKVDMGGSGRAYPRELSGGQQQRVAIARALAMHPQLMLFDEPTSALDPETVGEVLSVMKALVRDGMTMLVVTHELSFAREAADHVAFMADGVIAEEGDPKMILRRPETPALRSFLTRLSG